MVLFMEFQTRCKYSLPYYLCPALMYSLVLVLQVTVTSGACNKLKVRLNQGKHILDQCLSDDFD